jgi:hypothetical protein
VLQYACCGFAPASRAGTTGSSNRAGLVVDKARKVNKKSIHVEPERWEKVTMVPALNEGDQRFHQMKKVRRKFVP